jgi:cytidylate kinase
VDEELAKVRSEMEERDRNDASRENSPLIKADDAIHIDTTGLAVDEVVSLIAERVHELERTDA